MSDETEHARFILVADRLQSILLVCLLEYRGIIIPNNCLSDCLSQAPCAFYLKNLGLG